MVFCTGCNREFPSALSHSLHLQCTNNLNCHAVFHQALAFLPNIDDSDSEPEINDETYLGVPDHDLIPDRFGGDFFGIDYDMGDFGMVDDDDENESGVIPSDSEDDDDFNQGQGWESARDNALSRSPSPQGEIFDDDDEDVPPAEDRHTAEDRFLLHPTIVSFCDVFPQSAASLHAPFSS